MRGIVGRSAGPAEVERHAAHERPQVELPADKLRAVIDPERLRAADLSDNPFERLDDIAAAANSAARRSPATVG
jgi:hypothetical protein